MAFFNNKVCSMLFLLSTQFVWEQLPLAKNYDKDCSNAILLEFVNLSLETLKNDVDSEILSELIYAFHHS